MVAILASIGSLLMVLVACAAAMRWYIRRFHGVGDVDRELRALVDDDRCYECKGTGALRRRGELRPCTACEGTGVTRASF